MTTTGSARSEVFAAAEDYVVRYAALDPQRASTMGIPGYDHLLTDHGIEATEQRAALAREALDAVGDLAPQDDIDRISVEVMRERLASTLMLHDSGESSRFMSVLWSPAQSVRQVFELMPHATAEQRETLTRRLEAVPAALRSWRELLASASARGEVTSRRQVEGVARQLGTFAAGSMTGVVERICGANGVDVPGDMRDAALAAQAAFGEMSSWLESDLLPKAPDVDGVGRERYAMWSRSFNGADLDLDAIYAWGWEDLERITERMDQVARRIDPDHVPGSSLLPIEERLNADPAHQVTGTDDLLQFLRDLVERTTDMLADVHFDIDPRIRTCEVRLAPAGSAAAPYYIGPADDLSRPGISWFPVIDDSDVFPTWHHVTTWYHEAVPGHHLQIATATVLKDRLSRFQRTMGNTSGYAEGWALYAERFMDELGAFDEPGIEMGYLSSQAMRASRVVVDIGMHLGLTIPAGVRLNGQDIGGRRWDADLGREFMIGRALLTPGFAASEIDRYLAIPGQAISYKVGEKHFLEAREAARARLGERFDLKAWHMHALRLGGMGLDTFRREMAAWAG